MSPPTPSPATATATAPMPQCESEPKLTGASARSSNPSGPTPATPIARPNPKPHPSPNTSPQTYPSPGRTAQNKLCSKLGEMLLASPGMSTSALVSRLARRGHGPGGEEELVKRVERALASHGGFASLVPEGGVGPSRWVVVPGEEWHWSTGSFEEKARGKHWGLCLHRMGMDARREGDEGEVQRVQTRARELGSGVSLVGEDETDNSSPSTRPDAVTPSRTPDGSPRKKRWGPSPVFVGVVIPTLSPAQKAAYRPLPAASPSTSGLGLDTGGAAPRAAREGGDGEFDR
ncbi:hypothetical protein IAT38_001034 [Cryptococcus sp. DSM 104549]